MPAPRVLFILKSRDHGQYGSWNYSTSYHGGGGKRLASGLSISATQMAYALDELNIENKLVHVIDNNGIDREVQEYRPTHVMIEAFWVVPEKFAVLKKLHPTVQWVVRNHSKTDFLAHEGAMIGWAIDYIQQGITLACNSPEATADFKRLAISTGGDSELVQFLPNFYRCEHHGRSNTGINIWKAMRSSGFLGTPPTPNEAGHLNVGCFGAIRPLKNHLHQALAAIQTADELNLVLKFWINSNRVEGKAEAILNSLRSLFKRTKHSLVEISWKEHDEFVKIAASMDLVMQVSNSETFNIVAADAVTNNVPVLTSPEVPWLESEYQASPNNVADISKKLTKIWLGSGSGLLLADQKRMLREYAHKSKLIWGSFLQPKKT